MPTIKLHQQPLLPQAEYCGQARKVTQEWSKPKPKPDGTLPESHMIFRVPLWLPDGRSVTTLLRVMDNTGWVWGQACKSGEMIPQGEEVQFTPDDFENRVFYFGIEHREYNGIPRAEVKFHAKAYAIQVNPALEGVSFPNAAPRPIYLKSAVSAGPESSPQPPREPLAAPSPPANSNPPPPLPSSPPPPASEAKEQPAGGNGVPEGITEDEFREALAYAKRLAAEKQNPPKDKAA
jgi:hypothetical protein